MRATARMADGLRRFSASRGVPEKYHHTVTCAWVRLVAAAIADTPEHTCFDDFIEAHPDLLDKNALARCYSPLVMNSVAARTRWVEPDREGLPQ